MTGTPDESDAALADFTALNDPARRRRLERAGGYFVVEGVVAIERLLSLPDWQIRSVALLPKAAHRLAPMLAERQVEPIVVGREQLERIVGFDIHRGALASVERRPRAALAQLASDAGPAGALVVAEGVNDHENLGALYRNAAAFGAAGVALDPSCADPFYRRSVRVSAGHVLGVPTADAGPLPAGLDALHAAGVTTVALSPRAERPLEALALGPRSPVALVVGAEGPGLTEATAAACSHRAAISMAAGVDSLNVATAAAVALHHLRTSGGQ